MTKQITSPKTEQNASAAPNSGAVSAGLNDEHLKIIHACHHDPFSVLGRHSDADGITRVRAFFPGAKQVFITGTDIELKRLANSDLFEAELPADAQLNPHYEYTWSNEFDQEIRVTDPYTFLPVLSDFDLHLFKEGKHLHVYRHLGAHLYIIDGIYGVLFAVWAPNASRVSVVGNFNQWDGRRHPMRSRGSSGVWELFIPDLKEGELYKFEIRNQSGGILVKSDPYAYAFELRPKTACIVCRDNDYTWKDQNWMQQRASSDWLHQPFSAYEVHLGSWRRHISGDFLTYREMAEQLVNYVKDLGYTHIQLLPITEHPLDASWGYQTTGYFAATRRFGEADDLRYMIEKCHENGLGVILDWVPGHFPKDGFALGRFDGSALYEHDDPRQGEHRDWGTYIYNYERNEVRNFLLASAVYWLEEFHLDGLRVDAVASMLYLDYSREEGDWLPNMYGGNENLAAISFLRELNEVVHKEFPGALVIAEESTAWPQVTRPTWLGGLGFSMKWNMGWMHDNLVYFSKESIHRRFHHDQLTFGLLYAFTENFVLPLSHDEVVHGKGALVSKMPGDRWQQFANLRLLYTYMFTYPGKKLLFMGGEIAQCQEWRFDQQLDWYVLDYPHHQGIQSLIRDLNRLYRDNATLYRFDFESQGFEWLDCHDSEQSVIAYLRRDGDDFVIVVLNFTPVIREHYRIGVPEDGEYEEIMNSDSSYYDGSNIGNGLGLRADHYAFSGRPFSLQLTLPPLAGIVLRRKK